MFDPCFPKVPEGSFGETSGLTTPNFPDGFFWRGCLGCAGGGLPMNLGRFRSETIGKMGVLQPKFFPRVFFSAGLGKKRVHFFSTITSKNFGEIWAEEPPFSPWFSFGLGPGHPSQRNPQEDCFEPALFQIPWGELWGKSGLKTPQFTHGYLWPGWLGWPPLPNGLGSLVPQKP